MPASSDRASDPKGDPQGADLRPLAEGMAQAASDLLAALDDGQRARARLPFDDATERTRWYYTPNDRGGLSLGEMGPAQERLTHRLVATGLSEGGYVTASTIIGLENTLDALEEWRTNWYPGRGRDVGKYFVSVFGEPGQAPWGWRFEGHHVSLHYTIATSAAAGGPTITPLPTFFGADPAQAPFVGASGELRPLAGEEELGRALIQNLPAALRETAIISDVPPPDIVMANRPRIVDGASPIPAAQLMGRAMTAERQERIDRWHAQLGLADHHFELFRYSTTPKGVAAGVMPEAAQTRLRELLHQYVDRMPDAVAQVERGKLSGDGFDAIHFAWAGGVEPGQAHYYRLQGPRLLVEYDKVQREANHIHSVWRDPEGDFGYDVLARHYASAHAPADSPAAARPDDAGAR